MSIITIGADPEIFVTLEGEPVSAHTLIPGDKENPFKVACGAIQVDGTALEFNIDPARTEDEFLSNIERVMEQLRDRVDNNYEFLIEPSVVFSDRVWKSIPTYAKRLGCDPDYSAWLMYANSPPPVNKPMRTASGHVHIGITDMTWDMFSCGSLAREMDYFLGLFTLDWDHDDSRRTMYGQAGAFRVKPYGVEYRTPSNAWLRSQQLTRKVFSNTLTCARLYAETDVRMTDEFGDLAQTIINEGQRDWRIRYPVLEQKLKEHLDTEALAA